MSEWQNSITDVQGLTIGQAEDHRLKSGVTALLCDAPCVAAVHVMGGAPGTRDTELLLPENTVERVDGLVLAGGSAFGLDAASGVQAALREMGRGFAVGPARVPIVPGAILFDLLNGGDKDWGRYPPYRELGYQAAQNAGRTVRTGSVGAGTGALTAGLKGGLGTASMKLDCGFTLGAIVAVNALGSATLADSRHFWAAPFEQGAEFGGLGWPAPLPERVSALRLKGRPLQPGTNTTIAILATDAALSKAEAKRLAVAAHDGFARALWPAHTPMDGDLIFSLATGAAGRGADLDAMMDLAAFAGTVMARAIARGVHDATPADGDVMPCWSSL
ncbi:P1 family peptidase [Xaviernesmea oryzae]|nr:P1 family peptidase [Xaviernesmea oryzae]SEL71499.1 L-aminopeptidase/D-esterase [Xaviernesmea oryzae]